MMKLKWPALELELHVDGTSPSWNTVMTQTADHADRVDCHIGFGKLVIYAMAKCHRDHKLADNIHIKEFVYRSQYVLVKLVLQR